MEKIRVNFAQSLLLHVIQAIKIAHDSTSNQFQAMHATSSGKLGETYDLNDACVFSAARWSSRSVELRQTP